MLAGDMLRRSAKRFPDKPAIICGDETLTYRALDERANALAHALIGLRLPKGSKVAMLSRNVTDYGTVFFGVARTGYVLVNISVLYAPEELTFVLNKADTDVLIFDPFLGEKVEAVRAEIARAESLDTGKRYVESEYDVADVVSVFRHYAAVAGSDLGRVVDTGRPGIAATVVKEPIGVCSLITPWNYPLLQASWKVAPCLAAGNTFVLKPSEITPHSTIHLVRLLEEAGLPAGVGPVFTPAANELPMFT